MFFLWLFKTAGWICGPMILLAGIIALVLCVRATRRSDSPASRRNALIGSLTPLAFGICGAIVGLVVFLVSGAPGGLQQEHWLNLGRVVLAGLVVSAIPLIWSLMLFRRPSVMA